MRPEARPLPTIAARASEDHERAANRPLASAEPRRSGPRRATSRRRNPARRPPEIVRRRRRS
jgi:hypothetical protein